MIFQQFIDKDLGQVSYIIADDISKEASIIDPRRDIKEYIDYIAEYNLNLKYIINTHPHADFISGHMELKDIYPSSKIVFHKDLPTKIDIQRVKENDILPLGEINLQILETPGHTPYCISIIVNENDIKKYIFTGDILFVGDIARPDLLGVENIEHLTQMSYNTAQKLYSLDDNLIVFTSHIQGSLCGKDIKNQFFSTINIEKKTNHSFSLSQKTFDKYKQNLINQNLPIPLFFTRIAEINIEAPNLIKNLPQIKTNIKLDEIDIPNSYIIDIREPNIFIEGFIQNSINIAYNSNVSLIAGSLLDISKDIYLIGDEHIDYQEFVIKLRRVGLDNIVGILSDDILNNGKLITFNKNCKNCKIINLDNNFSWDMKQFNKEQNYILQCDQNFKSVSISSYLLSLGYNNIYIGE